MNLDVAHPLALVLLALAAVPLLRHAHRTSRYPAVDALPRDPVSRALEIVLRSLAVLAVVAMVLGIAGLYRPAFEVERIGHGAQMVLLVDRSLSMDQPFAGQGNFYRLEDGSAKSKGSVARKLLAEFVERRNQDMFGMVVFSTFPIAVLPLTQKQAIVQATIRAGDVGRGLAETDIGAGLERALSYFEGQRYTGSRIVVLVSDGAGELNMATRLRIAHLVKRLRVSLYWIFIRSVLGPRITESGTGSGDQTSPERALHEFFSELNTPYRAYTAENPRALEQAIADVSRLQNLPIRYKDLVPREDLSEACFMAALGLVVALAVVRLLEAPSWR